MAKTQEQLRAIERAFAYEFAESTINTFTDHATVPGEDPDAIWHDLGTDLHEDDVQFLGEVVEYLEARGLRLRHASNPNYVQILDEDAAAPADQAVA